MVVIKVNSSAVEKVELVAKPRNFGKTFWGGPFCKKGLPRPLPKNS
jgi:hypothetical protein